MNGRCVRRRGRGARAALCFAVLNAAAACASAGPATPPAGSGPPPADVRADSLPASSRPELRWRLDGPLLGAGASLLAVGVSLNTTRKLVPPEGLDRGDVHWSFDRAAIGERSTQAASESDYIRDAVLAYPMAVAFVSQPSETRLSGTLRRSVLYAEAALIAEGIGVVLKNSADRPRPFTYLPADQRPADPGYDVTGSEAFRSMPSGHTTASFCAAAFAMTDHLISRPGAGWVERAAVPFVGGVLAGMTATLRVEAGQHFPSDVIVGGLIGTSSGVAVPLLHGYVGADGRRAPGPSASAWRTAVAGLLAGTGAGILIAQSLH